MQYVQSGHLRVPGDVIVNDVVYLRDVQTSSRNIRGYQQTIRIGGEPEGE